MILDCCVVRLVTYGRGYGKSRVGLTLCRVYSLQGVVSICRPVSTNSLGTWTGEVMALLVVKVEQDDNQNLSSWLTRKDFVYEVETLISLCQLLDRVKWGSFRSYPTFLIGMACSPLWDSYSCRQNTRDNCFPLQIKERHNITFFLLTWRISEL